MSLPWLSCGRYPGGRHVVLIDMSDGVPSVLLVCPCRRQPLLWSIGDVGGCGILGCSSLLWESVLDEG